MLLFSESKVFEKAIGEEATAVLDQIFDRQDAKAHEGLSTKEDILRLEAKLKEDILRLEMKLHQFESRLEASESKLRTEISTVKVDLIKWMVGLLFAQFGLLAGTVMLAFRLFLQP